MMNNLDKNNMPENNYNLTDDIYILLSYNGEKILSSAQSLAGDINSDQAVDLTDALQLLKYFNVCYYFAK